MTNTLRKELQRYFIRGFLLAPLFGGVVGAFFGILTFQGYNLLFAVGMSAPIGASAGLVFGVLIAWPTRYYRLSVLLMIVGGGTIIFALWGAILGPGVALLGGIAGFYLGLLTLLILKYTKIVTSDAPEHNRERHQQVG
jgi:hypothetical protein